MDLATFKDLERHVDALASLMELRRYCASVHDQLSRAGLLRAGLQCVLAQHEVEVAIEFVRSIQKPEHQEALAVPVAPATPTPVVIPATDGAASTQSATGTALPLVSVCAWCQEESGEKPQAYQTHGICERHARKFEEDFNRVIKLAAG